MIKITQIKSEVPHDRPPGEAEEKALLRKKAAGLLHLKESRIGDIVTDRRSLDARKKPLLYDVFTILVTVLGEDGRVLSRAEEETLVRAVRNKNVTLYREKTVSFPKALHAQRGGRRIVVAGSGPAGLFCAYMLAKHGFSPLLIERGRPVEQRVPDVERFFETGIPDPVSNVQFGEGGAGTFSDGKLYTASKDRDGLQKLILRIFTKHGAPENILYDADPHIGTDLLTKVVSAMRKSVIENGGEVRFETQMTGLLTDRAGDSVRVRGIETNRGETKAGCVVLACGHSARDTFLMLRDAGIAMEQKAFAAGIRIAHPQEALNRAMYGADYPRHLKPAHYKLVAKADSGNSVYTFCMCPGGYIINASTEQNGICVNGMSLSDRGAPFANSAVIRSVSPPDYRSFGESDSDALAGVRFQQALEQKAFHAGNGAVPVQMLSAFMDAENPGNVIKSEAVARAVRGPFRFADVRGLFPADFSRDLADGIRCFDNKLHGFVSAEAFVAGVETRTSSPVRIVRGADLQSPSVRGLYPCGEGAGYAGGIMSSAADGIRVALQIAREALS